MKFRISAIASIIFIVTGLVINANAADNVYSAKIVKLYTYKNYRTVVKIDKTIANNDGCTHVDAHDLFGLNIHVEKPSTTCTTTNSTTTVCTTNNNAIEEVYAALLAGKLSDSLISIGVAGCTAYGGGTIPSIIRVDLQ